MKKRKRLDGREYEVAACEGVVPASLPGNAASIDPRGRVELVVLSVKQKAARCRLLGDDRTFTLRAGRLWDVAPSESAVGK